MALPAPTPPPAELTYLPGKAQLLSAEWWNGHLDKLVDAGIHALVILVLLVIALKLTRTFVRRTVLFTVRPRGKDALLDLMVSKRQTTLISLFDGVITITLFVLATLMVLQAFGLEVAPLLASAGIAGVAIGFGAQSLVKDVLSGAFIIMEQQFSVGDVIKAASVSGAVEEINLRTVVLRDGDGSVHIIPNGQITQVTVLTRDWSRLVLDLDIAYSASISEASAVLKAQLDAYAAANPTIVLEPPEILGVQNLAESSVKLRAQMKVLPGKQWGAGRELLATIKNAFDDAGIEIPFPQRTLWIRRDDPEPPTLPPAA